MVLAILNRGRIIGASGRFDVKLKILLFEFYIVLASMICSNTKKNGHICPFVLYYQIRKFYTQCGKVTHSFERSDIFIFNRCLSNKVRKHGFS